MFITGQRLDDGSLSRSGCSTPPHGMEALDGVKVDNAKHPVDCSSSTLGPVVSLLFHLLRIVPIGFVLVLWYWSTYEDTRER